jgi:hypothetical protein
MIRTLLLCAAALLIAVPAFCSDDDAAKDAAKEAKKKEKDAKKKAEKEAKSAEAAKPSADPAAGSPDDLNARLSDTVARMEQMDKDWKNKRIPTDDSGKSSEKTREKAKKSEGDDKSADDEKESKKKESKEKKVSSKESKRRYSDSDYAAAMAAENSGGHRARVYYDGHLVEEGAWTEIGGVSSSSHTSGSEGPFRSYSEGSSSSTSIGVRATVIRLDGPDE